MFLLIVLILSGFYGIFGPILHASFNMRAVMALLPLKSIIEGVGTLDVTLDQFPTRSISLPAVKSVIANCHQVVANMMGYLAYSPKQLSCNSGFWKSILRCKNLKYLNMRKAFIFLDLGEHSTYVIRSVATIARR